jgi:hypothetical protein
MLINKENMYSLVIYYVLSSQFHTDVSEFSIPFYDSKMCEASISKVISEFKEMYEPTKIKGFCIKTGEIKNGPN